MKEKILKKITEIINLNEDEKERILSYWKIKEIKKNEYLLANGAICKYDSFIIKGSFKAYRINAETGKEEIIFFAIEDWWATDLGSFTHQVPSDFNIQALEDSTIITIDKLSFERMLIEIPKMERYFRIILQNYISTLQKRLLSYNSKNANERYFDFIEHYPILNKRIPQYLIAYFLGVTPEFLSAIKKKQQSS